MTEQKRTIVIIQLFLLAAVGVGFLAALPEFHVVLQNLGKDGFFQQGAIICLLSGIFTFSFALFLLAFAGTLKSKETPASLLEVLGFAIFLRFLTLIFILYQILPFEGIKRMFQFQFKYISNLGIHFALLQLLLMILAMVFLGKGDEVELTEHTPGRHGTTALDQFLSPKTLTSSPDTRNTEASNSNTSSDA